MGETRITKERIRNHFAYSWWKYLVLAVAAVVGWNLIYTSTAYHAPREKRLDVYFVTHTVPEETTEGFKREIMQQLPDLEDASVVSILYTVEDNYYGSIQLSTYMGAGEGDVYIMIRDRFDAFKESGVFIPLDGAIASGAINLRGLDTARGTAVLEDGDGTRAVVGIPAESLYGLMERGIDNRDLVIGVTAVGRNKEAAIRFVDWLIETMTAPKPDWLAEAEANNPQTTPTQDVSEIPSY